MPYLLDTNVFIDAKNRYYQFTVCPGFWDWLVVANRDKVVYSIDHVKRELVEIGAREGEPRLDELALWARERDSQFFLESSQNSDAGFQEIVRLLTPQSQYHQRARDRFLASADPHLIAVAKELGWPLVTNERSAPDSRTSVKIPDVCIQLDPPVECVTPFEMLRREQAVFVLRADR